MANLEDAKRCPKCGLPGEKVRSHPSDRGSKVHVYRCTNDRCKWGGTSWIVQVLKDGTIPERRPDDKDYPEMSDLSKAIARHTLEEVTHLPTELPPRRP